MRKIEDLFQIDIIKKNNVYVISDESTFANQDQTNKAFSDKWNEYDKENFDKKEKLFEFQKKWYLKLYFFNKINLSVKNYMR